MATLKMEMDAARYAKMNPISAALKNTKISRIHTLSAFIQAQ